MNDSSDEAMKNEKGPFPTRSREKAGRKVPPDDAFDKWLDHGLRQMFGDVEKEPIPPDLLALIKRDQEKGG